MPSPSVSPPTRATLLRAAAALVPVPQVAQDLGQRFAAAGHALHLVGGPVRDALLGRAVVDLDFTTDARPELVLELVAGWAEATWTTGIAFGTVGVQRGGQRLEVTTYRSDSYDRANRKPAVEFGTTLEGDLGRRDFAVNAMALSLPDRVLADPCDGLSDVEARRLRTPGRPEDSFTDDPLRMLRAARFASTLGFSPTAEVVAAMGGMADRLSIVSAERVRDELSKLLLGANPRAGLQLLVSTGLADVVLPELPGLRLEIDPLHRHKDVYEHSLAVMERAISLEQDGPDLILRMTALLHDIGKPRTRAFEPAGGVSFHHHEVVGAAMARKRLKALGYPKAFIEEVCLLVTLHLRFHGYGEGEWTDAAVRRYVRDAGDQLPRLHQLVRSDCTTRNRRRAAALAAAYDALEARIDRLAAEEDLASQRPDLDGNQIMALLGLSPGPLVGQAYQHLLALRLEHGPLGQERAEDELRSWAAEQGHVVTPPAG